MPPTPVADDETHGAAVTATELMAYDQAKLACFLKTVHTDRGYDISCVAGVMELTNAQRDELADKIQGAALRIKHNVDELHERLARLAGNRDGSPEFQLRQVPTESPERTPPPIPCEFFENACRDNLIRDGGRPACSPEELSHIRSDTANRYRALLSWVTDTPDTQLGAGELETVFSRQCRRWWNFRKSQWFNRGLGESEEEFCAFVTAEKREAEDVGNHKWASSASFDQCLRAMWKDMPRFRQIPNGQSFDAYKDIVELRLRPYQFTRPLEWKMNPRQQDVWTNWLEYLSFEKWHLEGLTANVHSLEPQFFQSWRDLAATDDKIAWRQEHRVIKTEANRDASDTAIRDFVRQTRKYKRNQRAAYYQRHRVDWAVREARLLEAELAEQANVAERIRNEKMGKNKTSDTVTSSPHAKGTKRRLVDKEVTSRTTKESPSARTCRRSDRLAKQRRAA